MTPRFVNPKPPRQHFEQWWRKRQEQKVTAIAGFNCGNGVVIAGDTEESFTSGNDKAYAHKVFPVVRERARLCVAGAGRSHLIDYANEKIVTLLDSGSVANSSEFEAELAILLDTLYKTEFVNYPIESKEGLHIGLLVGIQFAKKDEWEKPSLLECQSNLVTRIGRTKQSCILGTGELLKESAIQFSGWGLTTDLAEWASIYLIHQAKRRYGGVGGKTHIFTMRNDGTHQYNLGKNIYEKEGVIEAFGRVSQLMLMSADPSLTDSRSRDLFDAAKNWLVEAKRYLVELEKERGKKYNRVEIRSREIEAIRMSVLMR